MRRYVTVNLSAAGATPLQNDHQRLSHGALNSLRVKQDGFMNGLDGEVPVVKIYNNITTDGSYTVHTHSWA